MQIGQISAHSSSSSSLIPPQGKHNPINEKMRYLLMLLPLGAALGAATVGLGAIGFMKLAPELSQQVAGTLKNGVFGSFSGILKGLNAGKQFEVKVFAGLLPAAPMAIGVVWDTVAPLRSSQNLKTQAKAAKEGVTRNLKSIQWKKVVTLLAILGTALLVVGLERQIGLRTADFDASGHFIMKVAMGGVMATSISIACDAGGMEGKKGKFILAFVALYCLTDFAFLTNTTLFYHTPLEVLAGVGTGIAIVAGATGATNLAARCFISRQERERREEEAFDRRLEEFINEDYRKMIEKDKS